MDDRPQPPDAYVLAYRADYAFESRMVEARQRLLLDWLATWDRPVVLEIGCGDDLLVSKYCHAHQPDTWVIVEPAEPFALQAKAWSANRSDITVVEGLVEDVVDEVMDALPRPPDAVICASVLHEVADPDAMLAALATVMGAGTGMLHVSVPNAGSMHRRLAQAMGIIASVSELSARNRELGQPRVLDMADLRGLMQRTGFVVLDEGGYMLKPFTHAQMEQLPFLNREMLLGLDELGRQLPDWASEIFLTAKLGTLSRVP